jgi:hypothetical protein
MDLNNQEAKEGNQGQLQETIALEDLQYFCNRRNHLMLK